MKQLLFILLMSTPCFAQRFTVEALGERLDMALFDGNGEAKHIVRDSILIGTMRVVTGKDSPWFLRSYVLLTIAFELGQGNAGGVFSIAEAVLIPLTLVEISIRI